MMAGDASIALEARGDIPAVSRSGFAAARPPGDREVSQGFEVAARRKLSVCQRRPKSGRFVRASGMAPAAL
jgi:hypothetical protein